MNVENEYELTCEEVLDSLGAYALGAIDGDEIAAIEVHLVECTRCRTEVNQHFVTVGSLAGAVRRVSPPARRGVAGGAPRPAATPTPIGAARRIRMGAQPIGAIRRWILPAVSVAAALLLVGVGVLGVLLSRAIDERDSALYSTTMLSDYASADGQRVTLLSQPVSEYEEYEWQGSLLTAPGKRPVVVVAGCPKSHKYFTYWVWFSKEGERTPAGKLTVRSDGSGWLYLNQDVELSQFDTIGITVVLEEDKKQDVLVAPLGDAVTG